MPGIFSAFFSGQARKTQTPSSNTIIDAKVNNFAKIASRMNKQLPTACFLDLELLTKVVSENLANNPKNTSTRVTHKIRPDGSVDLQNNDLIYRLSPSSQGLVRERMGRHGADEIEEGIKASRLGSLQKGKFAYIPELRSSELTEGKKTDPFGTIYEGKFAYIPESRSVELIEGKITFSDGNFQDGTFKYNHTLKRMVLAEGEGTRRVNGRIEEGKFTYRQELRTSVLTRGKVTSSNGTVQEGKFTYIPELRNSVIAEGKFTSSNGTMQEGKFTYIPELRTSAITEGKVTFSNGHVQEGRFSYIHELNQVSLVEGRKDNGEAGIKNGLFVYDKNLNSMQLAKGSVSRPDGKIETGTFAYIPELQRYELVEGRTEKNGNWQEGTRKYIPELGRMHLIEGSISKNGVTKSGTLAYEASLADGLGGMRFILKLEIQDAQMQSNIDLIATISEMTNTFGNSKSFSNLNNLLSAWGSLTEATTHQAYTEKVTQLSEVYHQCKRTLLICVHPDRGGATDTAQQYLEPLQNLGRSINSAIKAMRETEPSFV
jgi:hypothetical protein